MQSGPLGPEPLDAAGNAAASSTSPWRIVHLEAQSALAT
jgi:hypothetical protein